MAGVTDQPFRSFMKEMGCGVMTSELVSARAIQENNLRTRQLMRFEEGHKPYGIQIFGEEARWISEGAKKAQDFGADFIDLNLGCPVNKIVKKGAGSALLKDLKKLRLILKALKKSVSIPVSLKIRTGWDQASRNADQVALMALEEGFAWMSIHGRTRSQAYSGKADWAYIKKIQSETSLKIVGNGDLISGWQSFQALKNSGCFAVMIGRGCLNNPWIFKEAKSYWEESPDLLGKSSAGRGRLAGQKSEERLAGQQSGNHAEQKSDLTKPLVEIKTQDYFMAIQRLAFYLENFYDERLFLLQLKKFAVWFSAGFPNSSEFRKNLFQEKNKGAVLARVADFFEQHKGFKKPEPCYEPFLMQGHG